MGFQVRTPREAYLKVQKGWLPYIDLLGYHLGINLQTRGFRHKDDFDKFQQDYMHVPYHEDSEDKWTRSWHNNARDTILFNKPAHIPKCELLSGESHILDETPEFAIVQECDNRNSKVDGVWDVKFLKGETVAQSTSKTETEGWSFQNKFKVGGSYGGVNFENTTTVGAHGDYERMKARETSGTDGLQTNIQIVVPAGGYYKVDQYQNKAEVEVINMERCGFDVACEVWCDSHQLKDLLKDNKRVRRLGHTHSYCILKINSSDDLYEILSGISPDFPNQRENLLESNKIIKHCFDVLTDTSKWSLESQTKVKFDNANHGVLRIIDMLADKDEDKFVQPESVLKNPADAAKLEPLAA